MARNSRWWCGGIAVLLVCWVGQSRAGVIASWSFDDLATAGSPITVATGSGAATLNGVTRQVRDGNGSPHSLAASGWTIGDYVQFEVSTLGLGAIGLTWDQGRTAGGTRYWDFAYSTDGVNFTTVLEDYEVFRPVNGSWDQSAYESGFNYAPDLTGISALHNQPTVWFRMIADASAGGLDVVQFDDVVITGSVPEPAAVMVLLVGALTLRVRRRAARQSRLEHA